MSDENLQATLLDWIQRRRPHLENLEISEFSKPEAGASNETLLFEITYRQNDATISEQLVARLQPAEAGTFPNYDLALQYKTMELLANTDVKVPKLAGFESDTSILGVPFYLMYRLPGKVIAENPPYHMEGWFTELSDSERGQIWRNGISTIAEVNRQDWQELGFDFIAPTTGQTCLQKQLQEYYEFLLWAEAKGRPYPQLHTVYQWLLVNQPHDEPTALCWGDSKTANLLIEGTDVSAALDWEMVRLGNPVDDLAWWMTLDNSMSEGLARLIGMEIPKLGGLPSKQEMIDQWEQESGFSAAELDYYEVLGAFKFGVIMASIGHNLMRDGILPAEMEMDINNTCTPLLDRLCMQHNI